VQVAQRKLDPQRVAEADLTPSRRERILDLASQCIQYEYAQMELEQTEYHARILAVWNAKKNVEQTAGESDTIPVPNSPDHGHMPGRFGVGLGYREDSLFAEMNWRPAYHDLFDSDLGHDEGSEFDLLDVRGRYYEKSESLKLQELKLIEIASLKPRDFFFKPISWKFSTGFSEETMPNDTEHLLYFFDVASGLAWEDRLLGLFYSMAKINLNAIGRFQHNFAFGPGLEIGVIKNVRDWWKIAVKVHGAFYELGDAHKRYEGLITQSFAIRRDTALNLQVSLERSFGLNRAEIELCFNRYF
jgi:hypothetical protein